jgi:hypothetical protein
VSKWRVTMDVDDPEDHDAEGVNNLVWWALENDPYTTDMDITRVTVDVRGDEAYVRVR